MMRANLFKGEHKVRPYICAPEYALIARERGHL